MKIKKIVQTIDGEKFYVSDDKKDYHTKHGFIKKEDLCSDDDRKISTHSGKESFVYPASFIDSYKKLNRGPQTISLKDIGSIIAYTAVGKDSVVADAGVGTGGVSCFLARYVKKIYAFDRKTSSIEIAKKNCEELELDNVTFDLKNVYEDDLGIKPVDLFVLDVPDPDIAIKNVLKYVKKGGYIVNYSPNVSQVHKLALTLPEELSIEKTLENIERLWNVDTQRTRPMTKDFAHTGFLTFIRKIK